MSRCPSFSETTELGVCSTGQRCCPKSLEQKYFWSETVQGGSLDPQQLFNCLFAVFMKWQQNISCVTWDTTAHLSTPPCSPRSWDAWGNPPWDGSAQIPGHCLFFQLLLPFQPTSKGAQYQGNSLTLHLSLPLGSSFTPGGNISRRSILSTGPCPPAPLQVEMCPGDQP